MSRIVAFGDSISRGYGVAVGEGWVERLPALLPGCTVINAGGNGNTSREGLGRLGQDVLPALLALVLIEFGGNDAEHDGRAVGVEEFASNLSRCTAASPAPAARPCSPPSRHSGPSAWLPGAVPGDDP